MYDPNKSYGWKHTPAYIPNWYDSRDVAGTFASHTAYAMGARGAAYMYGGSWAPTHSGILYEAFFSPKVLVRGGSSAMSETMFALRVYSTPFRVLARYLGPVGMAVWLGYELYDARNDPIRNPHTTNLSYAIEQRLAAGDFENNVVTGSHITYGQDIPAPEIGFYYNR